VDPEGGEHAIAEIDDAYSGRHTDVPHSHKP
jgi:hypothetical protein